MESSLRSFEKQTGFSCYKLTASCLNKNVQKILMTKSLSALQSAIYPSMWDVVKILLKAETLFSANFRSIGWPTTWIIFGFHQSHNVQYFTYTTSCGCCPCQQFTPTRPGPNQFYGCFGRHLSSLMLGRVYHVRSQNARPSRTFHYPRETNQLSLTPLNARSWTVRYESVCFR